LLVRNPDDVLYRERGPFFRWSERWPYFGFLGECHVNALNLPAGIASFVDEIQTDEGKRNANRFDLGSVMLGPVGVDR
jgi:hypothetical protein